jgi:hypothetical protein
MPRIPFPVKPDHDARKPRCRGGGYGLLERPVLGIIARSGLAMAEAAERLEPVYEKPPMCSHSI